MKSWSISSELEIDNNNWKKVYPKQVNAIYGSLNLKFESLN